MGHVFWVVPCHARTRREGAWVARLARSARKQTLRPQEVLLVDDASPAAIAQHPGVRVIRCQKRSGPATARNVGVAAAVAAGARFILFTDLDCMPAANWTQTMVTALVGGAFDAIGGNTVALG